MFNKIKKQIPTISRNAIFFSIYLIYYFVVCLALLGVLEYFIIGPCMLSLKAHEKIEKFLEVCEVSSSSELLLLDYVLLVAPFIYLLLKMLHIRVIDQEYFLNLWLADFIERNPIITKEDVLKASKDK